MTTKAGRRVERRGFIPRLTAVCVRYVERLMPDPYLFAVILTLVVVGLVALLVRGATPGGVLKAWYGGVWGAQNIYTFAFQMVLVLVTGYTLAEAPILKRAIIRIASKPANQVQGALLCFGVSAVFSLLNWGLGLVAGALVARQVAKRLAGAHFGFLIASHSRTHVGMGNLLGALLLNLTGDRGVVLGARPPPVIRLQDDEHRAEVGGVGALEKGFPGDADRVGHARDAPGNLVDPR